MRKTLAASALGAALVFGGPSLAATAAPSDSASPVATDTATATATATEQVNTTETVHEKDRTGLWGLLGLAGLAGLAGLRKRPEHHVERVQHTTPARTTTDVRHTDHVNNPIRTAEPGHDANDVRVRTEDTLRNNDPKRTI